jgi:hypothetical protein
MIRWEKDFRRVRGKEGPRKRAQIFARRISVR